MYHKMTPPPNLGHSWVIFEGWSQILPSTTLFRHGFEQSCSAIFCLTTCVCVCHSFHGPLRECLRARCFRATLLLHTTCVRSCCTWRASCVAAKYPKIKKPWRRRSLGKRYSNTTRMQNEARLAAGAHQGHMTMRKPPWGCSDWVE